MGLVLVILAVFGGLFSVFHAAVPFEIPLTAGAAGYWAAVLMAAGVVALLGSIGDPS